MAEMYKTIREEIDEAFENGKQPKIRRVLALDFGRGGAIFFVIFLHAAIFNAFSGSALSGDVSTISPILIAFTTPFIILGSWASIFAIVTGAAALFSTYNHLVLKKKPAIAKLKSAFIRFIILIIINFIYLYFFINPTENIMGMPTQSLFTGSIHNLQWHIPSGAVLFHSSAFIMIAFSNFGVTLICLILFKNGGNKAFNLNFKRNFIVLTILMCIFLYSAPSLQSILTPVAQDSYTNGNYIISMLLTWLIGIKHCVFPFMGHAICGGTIALFLLHDKNSKNLMKYRNVLVIVNFIIFFISLIVNYFTSGVLLNLSSPVQHFSYYILNFALQIILTIWAFAKYDFNTVDARLKFSRQTIGLRRFGTISLTCFLMEQPIAALIALFTDTLIPNGLNNAIIVPIWTALYAYAWWKAVFQWDHKKNLKGSIEYKLASIGKSKEELMGCPDLLGLNKNIYEVANLNRDGTPKTIAETEKKK